MRTRRRLAIGALVLLVSACGSATSEISPDTVPAAPTVAPDACSLVPMAAVATALALPSAAELPAATGSPAPQSGAVAAPAPTYVVTAVGTHPTVGQCTYRSALGPTLVVNVFPKSTLAGLADYTAGLRPLGPALVSATDTAGLITLADGGAVLGLALNVGGLTPGALARRLAAVATAATGQSLPVPSLSASLPAATASAAPTPAPSAGQVVTGVTASQTVQETGALKFDPATTTVSVGGVVLWTNTGPVPHNVTFDANPELTSGTMSSGDRYELKFTTAGQYQYHCTFHPGMDGTLTVS